MFNALQPGVFALSGWDLVGALTLDRRQVGWLLKEGDTRWIHRSAYDLMNYRPDATESLSKMPRGTSLYGSLPAQLKDPNSFARRLRDILAVRKRYHIATAKQVDVPPVAHKAMLVMVHQLSDAEQVTVLNFSAEPISGSVISERLVPGSVVVDMFTDEEMGEVDDLHSFAVHLGPHEGRSLLVLCPGRPPGRIRLARAEAVATLGMPRGRPAPGEPFPGPCRHHRQTTRVTGAGRHSPWEEVRLVGGSREAALQELHDRHAAELWRFAMRLTRDRELSEDVVQEVLLKAWKDPGLGLRDDGAARAWLFTASRNLIIDRWRSAAARREQRTPEPLEEAVRRLDQRGAGPLADRRGAEQPVGGAPGRDQRGVLRGALGGRHLGPAAHPGGDGEVAAALRAAHVEVDLAGEGGDPAVNAGADRFSTWDAAYVLGSLSPAERREFEEHLAGCPACQAAVSELAGMPGLLAQVPPEDAALLAVAPAEIIDDAPPPGHAGRGPVPPRHPAAPEGRDPGRGGGRRAARTGRGRVRAGSAAAGPERAAAGGLRDRWSRPG